jgi:hypothetical protein
MFGGVTVRQALFLGTARHEGLRALMGRTPLEVLFRAVHDEAGSVDVHGFERSKEAYPF